MICPICEGRMKKVDSKVRGKGHDVLSCMRCRFKVFYKGIKEEG